MGKVPAGLAKYQAAKKAAASGTAADSKGMMHKMPSGHMMSDAEMKKMAGGKMPPKGMPKKSGMKK